MSLHGTFAAFESLRLRALRPRRTTRSYEMTRSADDRPDDVVGAAEEELESEASHGDDAVGVRSSSDAADAYAVHPAATARRLRDGAECAAPVADQMSRL